MTLELVQCPLIAARFFWGARCIAQLLLMAAGPPVITDRLPHLRIYFVATAIRFRIPLLHLIAQHELSDH